MCAIVCAAAATVAVARQGVGCLANERVNKCYDWRLEGALHLRLRGASSMLAVCERWPPAAPRAVHAAVDYMWTRRRGMGVS